MLGIKNKKKIDDNEKIFFKGQWKAVEEIGAGSYGKVYKSKRDEFGLNVYSAIKQIEIPQSKYEINNLKTEGMTQKDITTYYEQTVKKWLEEINFMSIFKDSQNIVNIEDYEIIQKKNEIGWIINIRMELLKNLNTFTVESKITDKEVLKMAIDITKALEDCEKQNVIHRDIKPDNVFVNSKGIYKLGDFGIAKHIDKTVSNMSKKGTENYMAPELYKNEKGNKTVDIYSLGIMLYRFFNYNRLPFLPDYPNDITLESREEALYKRVSGEKMKAPQNATRDVAEIILKMCNYYPKDRYQSAIDLRKDLDIIYKEIKEPRLLFDLNEKQMNKIYNESEKVDIHEQTLSIFNNTESEENKEKVEEIKEIVKKENQEEEKKQEEIAIEQKLNEEENPKEMQQEEQIKNEVSIKIKSNIKKIVACCAIIIIVFVLYFAIKSRKLENQNIDHEYVAMIEVIGMTGEDATGKIKELGLEVEYEYVETENEEEIGKVLEQSILKDEQIEKGAIIKLKIAVSKEKVVVTNVVGKTLEEAKNELEALGLMVSTTEQNNEEIEAGRIISQMTAEGTEVSKGTTIELLVSLGAEEKVEENKDDKQTKQTKKSDTESAQTVVETPAVQQEQPVQQETKHEPEQSTQQTIPTPTQKPTPITAQSVRVYAGSYLNVPGKTITASAYVQPENAENKTVVWSSSNPSVATINQNGKITLKSVGTTTITATVKGTNVSGSYNLRVYIPSKKGDLDGNGRIDANDAANVYELVRWGYDSYDLKYGDMNNDGKLTKEDGDILLDMFRTGQ